MIHSSALVREHRLAEDAQVVGVLVEGVMAGEGLEVAVHVQEHEADEDEAADGHQELQGDGRARRPRSPDQGRRCHEGHATRRVRRSGDARGDVTYARLPRQVAACRSDAAAR